MVMYTHMINRPQSRRLLEHAAERFIQAAPYRVRTLINTHGIRLAGWLYLRGGFSVNLASRHDEECLLLETFENY